jgi:hypothetical protein
MTAATEIQNIPATTAEQDDLVLLIPDGVGLELEVGIPVGQSAARVAEVLRQIARDNG